MLSPYCVEQPEIILPAKRKLEQIDSTMQFAGFSITQTDKKQEEPPTNEVLVKVLRTRPVGAKRSLLVHNSSIHSVMKGMYNVLKSSLDPGVSEQIRKKLTVTPHASGPGPSPSPYPVFRETKSWLCVPRYFGLETFGPPTQDQMAEGTPIHISLADGIAPRPYQTQVLDVLVSVLGKKHVGNGAFLEAQCGLGKTNMAIFLMVRLQVKVAVLVHKGDLMEQWKERIEQCTNARVGTVRGPKVDTEDKDIVLFMAQSVYCGDYDPSMFAEFGLVVVDESHHWAAQTLSKTVPHFPSRRILAVTATPDRKDKLEKVLYWYFGTTVARVRRNTANLPENKKVQVRVVSLPSHDGCATRIPVLTRAVTQICEDQLRNRMIARMVREFRAQGRYIMVMSERRKHLVELQQVLKEEGLDEAHVGLYVGESTKRGVEKREKNKTLPILLASNRMAKEGMDVKRLDTLILATPQSDIRQSVGRIQRDCPGKKQPLVVDLYDVYCAGIVHGMHRKRQSFYKELGFTISNTKYTF